MAEPNDDGEVQLPRIAGVARLDDLQLPRDALEILDHPAQARHLRPDETQLRMAFEDAADDEVAQGEPGPQLVVDVADAAIDLFAGADVGTARTLVLMHREAVLDHGLPERVVAPVEVRLHRMIRRDGRQHHAADDVVLGGPADLGDRRRPRRSACSWISPRRRSGSSPQKSTSQRLCARSPAQRRSNSSRLRGTPLR